MYARMYVMRACMHACNVWMHVCNVMYVCDACMPYMYVMHVRAHALWVMYVCMNVTHVCVQVRGVTYACVRVCNAMCSAVVYERRFMCVRCNASVLVFVHVCMHAFDARTHVCVHVFDATYVCDVAWRGVT